MGYIQGSIREQIVMFPESIDEYISEENAVRVFEAFVETLDMEALGFVRSKPAIEGRPGYNPRDMLKLYIYGYFNKIRSSRNLEKETKRNVEVMWLIKKLTPDFRSISDFRKDNRLQLKEAFKEFNKLCNELELFSKEYESIDGSKFKASNSKDRNFTLNKLDDRLKRLEKNIEEYMSIIEKVDEEESEKEREFTKEEIKEIEEKLEKLKKRKTEYEGYREELETTGESQKSVTDPESRLMKMHEGYGVCFNVQTAVDAESHLISGFEVTNKGTDYGQIEELSEEIRKDFGMKTIEIVADKGYEDSEDMMNCIEKGIIPNVILGSDKKEIKLETEYEECEISEEMKSSTKPEDIKKCIRAGEKPGIYERKIVEIKVVEKSKYEGKKEEVEVIEKRTEEEMKLRAEEGNFVRDIEKNIVYCPEGEMLRQKSKKKNGQTRYCNKEGCRRCKNKCTKSKFKEVDFGKNQIEAKCKTVKRMKATEVATEEQKVKKAKKKKIKYKQIEIIFRPDPKKMENRKNLSEHPFGTVKRVLDGGYFLVRGKEKVTGEIALLFLSYNMKRAINMVGIKKLIEQMV